MAERAARIARLLAAAGWDGARRSPLAGDASFRRYERLVGGPRPALLMDAPAPMEDVRPYVVIARHLKRLGFSAPEIYAEDAEAGLLVIEDFGDVTYTDRLDAGAGEDELYALAVDVLVALHRRPDAVDVAAPPYDAARYLEEAALMVDWYLPALRGGAVDGGLRREYLELWRGLLPMAQAEPRTLVLRDYHVDNLMWLEGREGVARCGLLDFQDAVVGPGAYDLVSLLEDARREVAPELAEAMYERYFADFPGLDREAFRTAGAVLAAQRNCKIIGIFTRLSARDGKPAYLEHIPRVWRLLEGDLAHPALRPLRAWLERNIPPAERRVPPARPAA